LEKRERTLMPLGREPELPRGGGGKKEKSNPVDFLVEKDRRSNAVKDAGEGGYS